MQDKVKLAAVQMYPVIAANTQNLEKIIINAKIAASNGANLIVFPECALTGYMFSSRADASVYMETIPGPSTEKVSAACRELGVYMVFGLLETEGARCFNSAAFIGPDGLIGRYRKNHLPFLGIDRWLDSGNEPFRVYETAIGKVGLFICYDCNFPESSRIMALSGADILALPTNWPEGGKMIPEHVIIVRAFENRVHLIATDRVGEERGARFIGKSKIINAWGHTLSEASSDHEEIIYGEVNLSEAREKRTIFKAGEFEVDFIRDRKPGLYGKIVEEM
jgi:predicted amidohydrolase